MASQDKATVFAELGKRFNLKDAVVKRILAVGISTLTEFRFFARDEADLVAELIAPVKDQLTNERIQVARLKHAWAAVTQADRAKEVATSTLQLDEEELLPPDTLAGLKEAFYKRYKLHLPVQQMPSDRLITKVHRGMSKRSLEVMDMWSVRTLFSQQHHTAPKRQKIGEQMYLTSVPDEEAPDHETHTAAAYLKRLWTYLAALAIAGCEPTDAVPTAAESALTESCEYVRFPLDLSYSYHHRAALLAEQLPEPRRLSVLVQLDRAERSEWAQRYPLSQSPLGMVVRKVFQEKDLHWGAVPLLWSLLRLLHPCERTVLPALLPRVDPREQVNGQSS